LVVVKFTSLLLLSLLVAAFARADTGSAEAPTLPPSSDEAAIDSLARLVPGRGTRILEFDGKSVVGGQLELTPGLHTIRFDSKVTVEPVPGRRTRDIHEVCEARIYARPAALYVLLQELIASRGARSWHHQLSTFVHDEEYDRAIGECICRTAPLE
jgi:hypothetical protein